MTSALRLLIFAGPNGSGKSTFTTPEVLNGFGINRERYINADDIARELSERMQSATQTEQEWAAFHEARQRRQIYREQKISFAFETVFSHPSTFLDIQACRELGFQIVVIFVTTENSAINVERVTRRVQSGGHSVEREKIISRYDRSMSFLPKIVEDADYTFVYDNSGKQAIKFLFRGRLPVKNHVLTSFLESKLNQPLITRFAESMELLSDNRFQSVDLPSSIQSSQFQGEIVWCGSHYIIQSTADGFVKHDLCLFTRSELEISTGSCIKISYKDGLASTKQV
jgi:predicted ABC-type ATPase